MLPASAREIAGVGTVHFFVLPTPVEVPVSKCLPHRLTFDLVVVPAVAVQCLAVGKT